MPSAFLSYCFVSPRASCPFLGPHPHLCCPHAVAPWWFAGALEHTVGRRKTERMLQLGQLRKPREALADGLVDEVVRERDSDIVEFAIAEIEPWLRISPTARLDSKMFTRGKLLRAFSDPEARAQEIKDTTRYIASPKPQAHMTAYLDNLKARAASKRKSREDEPDKGR